MVRALVSGSSGSGSSLRRGFFTLSLADESNAGGNYAIEIFLSRFMV